jgi:hypothetical protein
MGSEEFIRLQFEEYLLALLSCINYREHLGSAGTDNEAGSKVKTQDIEGDPASDFNSEFLAHWQTTANYTLFKQLTSDALLFSIVEPRHPCAGGLTIDDIQRRLAQQVAELHLDERMREGREALNKHLATGQKKMSTVFNNFWADIEAMREAQRKKNEEKVLQAGERASENKDAGISPPQSPRSSMSTNSWFGGRKAPPVDLSQAQASVNAAGQKAGAYLSSWGAWASERRKEWQDRKIAAASSATSSPPPASVTSSPTGTLASVTENVEIGRGRRASPHRRSEDLNGLGRSGSRRKRWSSILRMKDRSDSQSPHRKEEASLERVATIDSQLPKSPLSQGSPPEAAQIVTGQTAQETQETKEGEDIMPSSTVSEPTHEEPTEATKVEGQSESSDAKSTEVTAPLPESHSTSESTS